ncbi:MAG TPA: CHAD domain-containing protein [Bryobacteraceae bacterium]|nr:CHAD domain-containing protein [Bryobacteraceae bacterium]
MVYSQTGEAAVIGAGRKSLAADRVTRLLERLAYQISSARNSHKEEAVHDLRVAIRRLMQALAVFKPQLASKELKKIRRSLKDTMALAGEVRDCDIVLRHLPDFRSPGAAALKEKFQVRRKVAERALLSALSRWVARGTSSKWRERLEIAGFESPDDSALRKLPHLAKSFFKCGSRAADAEASAKDLHQFRIAAKELRYTLELFSPLYGPAMRDRQDRIQAVQNLLGRINDLHTVRRLVSQAGGHPKIEAALKKRQRRKTQEFRRLWTSEFSTPGTAKKWISALRWAPRKPMARVALASNKAGVAQA